MSGATLWKPPVCPWRVGALLLCWCLCCGASAVASAPGKASDIEITGYAREMPPGASMGAAYLTLRELAGRERVLERVELPAIPQGSAELHTSEEVAGMSRMRALKTMTLPGDGAIEMRPGAAHLMLRGVTLRAGQSLSLRLVFTDGSAHEVTLPVLGLTEQTPAQDQAEHHHAHHG